jgi:ATP-dependent Clp protease ATP-binding subunit ClpC
MRQIVDLQMQEIRERLSEHDIEVVLTDAARSWLSEQGFDPAFGARPLKRALQKYVESPLSVRLLGGEFSGGSTVVVDVDESDNKTLAFKQGGAGIPVEIPDKVEKK